MARPITVDVLLRQRKVGSNRIEFKNGWNPDKIFRSDSKANELKI